MTSIRPAHTAVSEAPPPYTREAPVQNRSPIHILDMSKEDRDKFLQTTFADLKVNKNNAKNIFDKLWLLQPKERRTKIDLLNKVERLTIEDIEAAQAITSAFDYFHTRYDQHNSSRANNDSTAPIIPFLTNVKTVSFGPSFVESILKATFRDKANINKIFDILNCMLKPIHLCVSAPSDTSTRMRDENWAFDLVDHLATAMDNPKLKTYTSHNYWFYNAPSISSTSNVLNIFEKDCPFTAGNPDSCTCLDVFIDSIATIVNIDGGGFDSELFNERFRLINLPHIPPNFIITKEKLRNMKIHSGELEPHEYMYTKEVFDKAYKDFSKWFTNNLSIIKKEDTKPCVCCGSE